MHEGRKVLEWKVAVGKVLCCLRATSSVLRKRRRRLQPCREREAERVNEGLRGLPPVAASVAAG